VINAALGNLGKAVLVHEPVLAEARTGASGLSDLAAEIRRGEVEALLITAWNPVHTAPADIDFGAALAGVPVSIYSAPYLDETAARATWFVPQAHELESWGDGRGHDGTTTLRQPLLAPLFGGVTEVEVLAALLGEADRTPYQRLRELHRTAARGDFEAAWTRWVADGLLPDSARPHEARAPRLEAARGAIAQLARPAPSGLEIVFAPDYKVLDGRHANNGWLQELPDPVSKLCWDNAALISPATARQLGLQSGEVVSIELRGKIVRAPVMLLPGTADEVLVLPLGYGRTGADETAARGVGFNAYAIRSSAAPWFDAGAKVTRTGVFHKLAVTHSHFTMEGRALALDVKVTELAAGKPGLELEEQRREHPSAFGLYNYSGAKWAMAIDLSKCTGCSACVVACQSENNTPVVGYQRITESREMHWLRIDRYFQGDLDDPRVITQPVMCVHCEQAPCEYVCPVNATVHSDEGLNEMVYNRCVGTRYCSNNCPYKVRRFNFFRYNEDYADVEKMRFNPDVTVRARGVMEKCTYCVQRIERARIEARVEGREGWEGEVVTACQQACPADAIVFGSLHDPKSRVSRLQAEERSYRLLNELNTRPRTWHLARVRNPNPELG
jgi:molybdopterin-containing oxidoreductase family iron-sulfur binding subunit